MCSGGIELNFLFGKSSTACEGGGAPTEGVGGPSMFDVAKVLRRLSVMYIREC